MIEIVGKEQLQRKLDVETVTKPISETIRNIVIWIQNHIMKSTPVITGRLRASITHEINEFEGRVATDVQYAPFVEYGHSQQVGRFVYAIGARLVAPWVPPSRVAHETSMRIRDIGPFTFTFQEAQRQIQDWLKEIELNIEQRFG